MVVPWLHVHINVHAPLPLKPKPANIKAQPGDPKTLLAIQGLLQLFEGPRWRYPANKFPRHRSCDPGTVARTPVSAGTSYGTSCGATCRRERHSGLSNTGCPPDLSSPPDAGGFRPGIQILVLFSLQTSCGARRLEYVSSKASTLSHSQTLAIHPPRQGEPAQCANREQPKSQGDTLDPDPC